MGFPGKNIFPIFRFILTTNYHKTVKFSRSFTVEPRITVLRFTVFLNLPGLPPFSHIHSFK